MLDNPAASGGLYITPTSIDKDSAGPNRARYTFLVAAGTYAVWGRVVTPSADEDSFWVSMDGGSFRLWNSISEASTDWAWAEIRDYTEGIILYDLEAGTHTLEIANREDGVQLDRLYITSNGDTPE